MALNGVIHSEDPFSGPLTYVEPWNYTFLAVLMFIVTTLSLCENGAVMLVTFRFKQLRQPLNYIIVNLSLADFLVSSTGGVISCATNYHGYFFLGQWACVLEGFAVTFFGKSCKLSLYIAFYNIIYMLMFRNSVVVWQTLFNSAEPNCKYGVDTIMIMF